MFSVKTRLASTQRWVDTRGMIPRFYNVFVDYKLLKPFYFMTKEELVMLSSYVDSHYRIIISSDPRLMHEAVKDYMRTNIHKIHMLAIKRYGYEDHEQYKELLIAYIAVFSIYDMYRYSTYVFLSDHDQSKMSAYQYAEIEKIKSRVEVMRQLDSQEIIARYLTSVHRVNPTVPSYVQHEQALSVEGDAESEEKPFEFVLPMRPYHP